MSVLISITTYKRPNELKSLIGQLKQYKVDIQVWDDDPQGKKIEGVKYTKFGINHGKKLLWLKFKDIFEQLKKTNYDYYIFLPDDVTLSNNFIERTVDTWNSIQDEKKICMSLLFDKRLNDQNWTGVLPIDKGKVLLTQWNDLCFICEKKFLNEIEVKEVDPTRWNKNPTLGSGLGSQISWYLYNKNFNQYNVKDKLIQHLNVDSKMNFEERKNNPLI